MEEGEREVRVSSRESEANILSFLGRKDLR
jgi:hypothetical protein